MPASLSNVAIEMFRDTFSNVYQGAAYLGNTSLSVYNCVGASFQWPIQGEAAMQARGAFQSQVPVSDPGYEQVLTTYDNWVLNIPVDVYQQAELQVNVLGQLGKVHAKSAGRREDQTLINALDAATLPAANIIADGGVNMTVAKLRQAATQMDEQNVDSDERFLIINPSQLSALLGEDEPTNVLYNINRTLVNGKIDTFLGFKIISIGERQEGGIPKVGNIRSCFAWQMDALGRAYSMTPTVETDWNPNIQSWLTISRMRLGASVLLPKGVIEIQCDES